LANLSKAIVFASGVAHARDLAASFAKHKINVRVIVGTTPADERSQILSDFSSGKVRVLVNVGVLTEGFDEPSLETIIIAKPTRSTLLYTQIVGRGTRIFDGKPHCTIIDISDTTKGKKPIGLPSLLGLPPDFDLQGRSVTEVAEEFEELETYCPGEAARVLTPEDIKLAYTRINLFMPPPRNEVVQQYSKLVWAEIGENNFHLGLNNTEAMSISEDALGRWQVKLYDKHSSSSRILGTVMDLREAFVRSDRWIQSNRSHSLNLLESDAPWRADSPTDAQKRLLKRIGVPITSDLTKGMASQIISKYYETNPKPKWLQNKIDYSRNRFR
jgi:ATP-dependent helicase IRC3